MKTILVATDFSKAAYNACLFAYELAISIHAKMIVYSAYKDTPLLLAQMPPLYTPENMNEFVIDLLNQEVKQLDADPSIMIEAICSENSSTEGILDAIKKTNPDLLIVGIKENNHVIQKIFGSTVKALINKLTIPMLVVPENKKFVGI